MKLNKATLVVPLAGLLLVGAAGAVAATSSDTPSSTGTVVPAAESPSPSAGTTTTPDKASRDTALTSVLDDLVAKGTITEAQKTAILDALSAERTARSEARQASREQLETFLADGKITQEEFDQLPEDSRIRQLDELMADGSITTEELQALGRGMFGGGRGHGHGPRLDTDGGTTTPTPTPSAGTSG